jgi:predicted transposase/invertase (TIGR01784 family)
VSNTRHKKAHIQSNMGFHKSVTIGMNYPNKSSRDSTMTDKSLGTYINPFTDFGFKKLFGSEESKPLLISFLNDLLPIEAKIKTLEFKNIEKMGMLEEDRKAVYDIYCRDEKGHDFIVELQRAKQEYFQDRAAYYSSFIVQDQATRGKWDFQLTPIYFVGILDFALPSFADDNYLHHGQITDIRTKEVMFTKLNFIYIEMAKFKKQATELANHLEQWLYFLRELVTFDDVPETFKGDVIAEAFDLAKLANMSHEDRTSYEISLKYYRDYINTLETAKKDAKEEGKDEERKETALRMLADNMPIQLIMKFTNLSEAEIAEL